LPNSVGKSLITGI